jgi:hypothetical protein
MSLLKYFEKWYNQRLIDIYNSKAYGKEITYELFSDSRSFMFESFSAAATIYETRCCNSCAYFSGVNVKHCTHHQQYIDNELTFYCKHFDSSEKKKDETIYY